MEATNEKMYVNFYEVTYPTATKRDNLVDVKELTSNEIFYIKEVDCLFLKEDRYVVGKIAFDIHSKRLNVFVRKRNVPIIQENI